MNTQRTTAAGCFSVRYDGQAYLIVVQRPGALPERLRFRRQQNAEAYARGLRTQGFSRYY